MRSHYEEMTSAELAAEGAALADAVAVVPIAAIEQHGPHLPLGTDAIIADHMIASVRAKLGGRRRATFLPTLRTGTSGEHDGFCGTLTLSWETARRVLVEIGGSLAQAGLRRLVIVNAHGGNTPTMNTAALELRRSHGMLAATCSWLRFGYPEGLLPAGEIATGIHGGAVETSLMMHFRPDLVRNAEIRAFPSLQEELTVEAEHLRAHGRLGFGWLARDLNTDGVVGDATLATPEIGAAIAEHQASAFLAFLDDVLAFDLSRLR